MSSTWIVPFPSDGMKIYMASNYHLIQDFHLITGCMDKTKIVIQIMEWPCILNTTIIIISSRNEVHNFFWFSLNSILIIPVVLKKANHYVRVIWTFKNWFCGFLSSINSHLSLFQNLVVIRWELKVGYP